MWFQGLLQLMGQCMRTYLAEATGSVAKGVAAAGLDVSLPADISRFAAFADELERHARFPPGLVRSHLPPIFV